MLSFGIIILSLNIMPIKKVTSFEITFIFNVGIICLQSANGGSLLKHNVAWDTGGSYAIQVSL